MKLLTGKDGAHQTFDILEDAEIKISPKQHQNLFEISGFIWSTSYGMLQLYANRHKIFIVLQ